MLHCIFAIWQYTISPPLRQPPSPTKSVARLPKMAAGFCLSFPGYWRKAQNAPVSGAEPLTGTPNLRPASGSPPKAGGPAPRRQARISKSEIHAKHKAQMTETLSPAGGPVVVIGAFDHSCLSRASNFAFLLPPSNHFVILREAAMNWLTVPVCRTSPARSRRVG